MFTGQYFDWEIGQYYLRARQYDPILMRMTGRDSINGRYEEPLTLHKYLYCLNDPTNRVDPSGLWCVWDDLAFGAAGAAWGLLGQAFSDALMGNFSGWNSYISAGVGGFVGGWATLYTGPGGSMVGGAIGNALSTFLQESFKSMETYGNLSGISYKNVGISAVAGLIPGPGIGGITRGRGSFGAVTMQMITKMERGIINNFTYKTFAKIFTYNMIEWSFAEMADSMGQTILGDD